MEMVTVSSFSYRYPGAPAPALSDLSCQVKAGECVCLTGDSGCGKSTLLLAIKGALRGGSRSGSITLPEGNEASVPVGMVFQNPESQIICTTVAEEVAFGPENLALPPAEIAQRVRRALRAVGMEGEESRNVDRFSAGQKQRLAIASVLSMNPSLLLLDEPTSQLDRQGKLELADLLGELKRQGYTILLAEHDILPLAGIIDRYLVMEGGRIVSSRQEYPETLLGGTTTAESSASRPSQPVLAVRGLRLRYPETGLVLDGVDLQVGNGERVHLLGQNGAGKSTLLRCLCGLDRPDAGVIAIAGVGTPRTEKLPGEVGVLFQNPARQLFAESVWDEVAFTLQRLRRPADETKRLVEETLEFCGISDIAGRAPLTLSFGEQHRVALASVLAPKPKLLLLDEPFAGLDFPQRRALLAILGELPSKDGTAVLIATHDLLPDPSWGDRSLEIAEGRITDAAR
jgi:energy-coupling factor transport system ATP-binding protein